jgi:hypothetical protein
MSLNGLNGMFMNAIDAKRSLELGKDGGIGLGGMISNE